MEEKLVVKESEQGQVLGNQLVLGTLDTKLMKFACTTPKIIILFALTYPYLVFQKPLLLIL